MRIDVIAACGEARAEDFAGKTAVVIDVLRATSNMVTALSHGCRSIVPVETVQQARQAQRPGDLLGGERSCRKIPGFDLGNSPFEYMSKDLINKRIIMTTTNGTRAVQKAQRAHALLACALLNVTGCAKTIVSLGRDVVIVCSGTQDEFSLEDGICAGLLVDAALQCSPAGESKLDVNDFGLAMRSAALEAEDRLEDVLLTCANGKRLRRLGFQEDIVYCAKRDVTRVVPLLRESEMVVLDWT